MYDDDNLEEIQNEFKRQELTHAMGPSISLIIHIVLFLGLFFLVKAQFQEEEQEVQVTMVQEATEEVIETPDEIDDITETELQSSDTSESEAPAEDAPDEINTDVSEETLDVPDTELLSFTVDTTSPYQTRTVQGKAVQVARGGGDKRALSTVLSALKWLKANQNPDGTWGKTNDKKPSLTALATLLYLAHGETPGSKHFGKTVQRALKSIVVMIDQGQNGARLYGMPMLVYAASEGYSLTSIKDLERVMNSGVKKMFALQGSHGWADYADRPGDRDISLMGWYFQAYKAAYLAGCEDPKLKAYIKKIPSMVMQNGYDVYGRSSVKNSFYYRVKPGIIIGEMEGDKLQQGSAMRAAGALVLQLFGKKQDAIPAANVIAREDIKRLNKETKQGFPLYSWYYATQVLYNNKASNPGAWKKWNDKFQILLFNTQHQEGYWETQGIRPEINTFLGDPLERRVYSTALAGLMLTVYYRYLPTTKLTPPKKKKVVTADSQGEVELDFL